MFSGISIEIALDRLMVENFMTHLLSLGTFFIYLFTPSHTYILNNYFL